MNKEKEKEKDAIIKELSISYKYSNNDISKILKNKGFKINIRILVARIKYFRWNAIIDSIENWEHEPNEKTIILIDNYINEYPDCWRSLRLKNSFS